MRNNVKAYKVVSRNNDNLVSAINGAVVYYTDGRLIKTINKTSLFIFENYRFAREFKCNRMCSSSYQIWEVSANNVKYHGIGDYGPISSNFFPYGTMFCSSLRMIKKVK